MGSKRVLEHGITEPITRTINKEIKMISKNTKNLHDSIKEGGVSKPHFGRLKEKGKTIKLSPSRFSPNKKHQRYLSMGDGGLLEIAQKPFDFTKPETPTGPEQEFSIGAKPEIDMKPTIRRAGVG